MSQPSYLAPPHTDVTYLSGPHVPTVVRLAKDVAHARRIAGLGGSD